MSTVEAAASLFGSEVSSSDPFTTFGDTSVASPQQHEFNTSYYSQSDAGDYPSDFEARMDLPGTQDGSALHRPGPETTNKPAYGSPTDSRGANTWEPTGWRDAQQNAYENLAAHAGVPGHTSISNYPTSSKLYDPYTPPMNRVSPSYDEPTQIVQHPPHDPYNPVVQNYATTYGPPGPTPPKSNYNIYNPATSYQTPPVPQTVTSQSYPMQYSSKTTGSASIPPPPAPATTLNRPKRFDAYDPPFLPSKPAKRTVGRSTLHPQSNIAGPSVYGAYRAMPSQSIPPDVPPVSSTFHGVDYLDASHIREAGIPSSLPDAQGLPRNNMSSDGFQSNAATNAEQAYVGRTNAPRQPPQSWQRLRSSHEPLPVNQASSHQFTHEPTSSTPKNFSPFQEPSNRVTIHDRTYGFSQSSPPNPSSYDPPPQYHISSGVAPQRSLSPQKQVQSQSQNSLHQENFGFSSMSETNIRDWNRSAYNSDTSKSAEFSALRHRDGEFHSRPSPQEPVSDDSEATLGGERVHSPDDLAPMSPNEYQATQSPNDITSGFRALNSDLIGVENVPLVAGDSSRSARTVAHDPSPSNKFDTNILGQAPSFAIDGAISSRVQPLNESQISRPSSPVKTDAAMPSDTRNRSKSLVYSMVPPGTEDPYAPSQHRRHVMNESSPRNSLPYSYPSVPTKPLPYDLRAGQELLVGSLTQTPYAPSPSLLGSNDPLGRTAARVPVFSFGFGGKLVTCFHGSSVLNTGFDVALASRRSMDVNIRILSKIIPDSALDMSSVAFPGPLFAFPGTPTVSLVRPGAAAQMKTKKAHVSQYLHDRAEEFIRGIGYLHVGIDDRRRLEGKLILTQLLKVMIENEGRLSGSPQIETAVRAALVPGLALSAAAGLQDSNTAPVLGLASSGMHTSTADLASFSYPNITHSQLTSHETPISVSTLRPSALDKIQEFLLRGERQKACHFAMDEKLWAHAMLIASSVDKEMWKAVVSEFLKSELGRPGVASHGRVLNGVEPTSKITSGRESLRVAYSMFSGQGAACVQELLPQTSSARGITLPVALPSQGTPLTANFLSTPPQSSIIPLESLSKWVEMAAMMLTSKMTIEASSALTALGDCLAHHQWTEAAHVCYLLAPQTSSIGGLGQSATRIVLVGSPIPHGLTNFHKDPDPIIFSEIVEFALSLTTPPKGQEAFNGLPHLQAFKLIRAVSLAEIGQMQLASRYCEAITASLGRGSPYFTTSFGEQLRLLSDRIIAAPQLDKSMSWIGGKMTKPSLDSIGTWLEGRFTKLITGDGDASPIVTDPKTAGTERSFSGPFSHYSTISSATTSTSPSPQPPANALPQRSGSAMAFPLVTNSHVQIDRASSAVDYTRRKHSPAPRIASANATTTSFAHTTYFNQHPNAYLLNDPPHPSHVSTPRQSIDGDSTRQDDVTWWGSSYASETSAQTPTATSYLRIDESRASSSSSGIISVMDDTPSSVTPTVRHAREPSYEDEEDLGLGNPKKPLQADEGEDLRATAPDKTEPAKVNTPEQQKTNTSGSGSWLSRFGLWGRRESTTGPVKANLGEETSFYYDKELKRWVNKIAATEASSKPAAPPPPPSRSQTASPGRSAAAPAPLTSRPPIRPASANDLTPAPAKPPSRARSNLIPKESDPPVPPIPVMPASTSPSGPPPPPSRPRSQAAKRNIRSRYVDVLQQDNAS